MTRSAPFGLCSAVIQYPCLFYCSNPNTSRASVTKELCFHIQPFLHLSCLFCVWGGVGEGAKIERSIRCKLSLCFHNPPLFPPRFQGEKFVERGRKKITSLAGHQFTEMVSHCAWQILGYQCMDGWTCTDSIHSGEQDAELRYMYCQGWKGGRRRRRKGRGGHPGCRDTTS